MRSILVALIALSVIAAAAPAAFAQSNNGGAMKQLKDCAKKGGTC